MGIAIAHTNPSHKFIHRVLSLQLGLFLEFLHEVRLFDLVGELIFHVFSLGCRGPILAMFETVDVLMDVALTLLGFQAIASIVEPGLVGSLRPLVFAAEVLACTI